MKENQTDLILLERVFTGIGEVSGFLFEQCESSDKAYVYSVAINGKVTHWEVFKKVSHPVCIDFAERIYSETERKEAYPKSNAFGLTAWNCSTYESALTKFKELSSGEEEKG